MAEVKEFQTETKKLLDLMINSIYTHKEIFLRELISNASDAIDKHHYITLTNQDVKPVDYTIVVEADKDNNTLSISDNGIGMTYDEVVSNLGTIAKSGSKEFIDKLEKNKETDIDIIGQFGVGFYSSFMVADSVEVYTRSPLSDKGYVFKSEGLDSYSIDEADCSNGTKIVLHLRKDTEDNKYSDYLDEYTIKRLIRKYSDYVRYPIKTWVTKVDEAKSDDDDKDKEPESHLELETINSMVPLWKKRKSDVTDEDLNEFYKQKFMDFQDPLDSMFVNVEGNITYNALVFIPKKPPFDMYSEKYQKGLQLYTKGVYILDKCEELIPDYLKFVKGIVDTADLPLNISREMLQEDRSLVKIAKNLEKKIVKEFERLLNGERSKYEEFFKDYGMQIKYGAYDKYGEKKDLLKDLLLFKTTNDDKLVTLKEYVESMPKEQEVIYFASAKDKESVVRMPQMDLLNSKDYNVLILTDDIDEFLIQTLGEYDSHKFKSINQGDLDLIDKDKKEEIEKLGKEKQDILTEIKNSIGTDVSDVVFSKRLTSNAVCLVSKDGISFEMEKVLAHNPNSYGAKAERVLEINPDHAVFKAVEKIYDQNGDISKYAKLLYSQALLIEGMELDNPIEFANTMCDLMVASAANDPITPRAIVEEKPETQDDAEKVEVEDVTEEEK